jgi:hypothetical protein
MIMINKESCMIGLDWFQMVVCVKPCLYRKPFSQKDIFPRISEDFPISGERTVASNPSQNINK